MSAARKTLKILALIYFVLGIASLVIGITGIATGKFESVYGSNAMLAAVVLVAKGVIDLAAGVAGIKGANKLRRWMARLSSASLPQSPRLRRLCSPFPRSAGSAVNIGAFVIVVYDLFFVQQAHAVKAENKDRL